MARPRQVTEILCVAVILLCGWTASGCRSRGEHVRRADRDAYALIAQKSSGKPWVTPPGYSILPAPESRMAIQGCLVHPCLPSPTTSLYTYNLPLLRSDFESPVDQDTAALLLDSEESVGLPIPPDAWSAIPPACLRRMVDFASIRKEADDTASAFGVQVFAEQSDDVRQFTLEDIVDLAVLNSRDYQTQKENLYLFALQLSQERFDYQCNFRPNNGFSLGYDHNRFSGITENNLSIPSGVGVNRALVTGGDILASFANNILLTFNGPTGFSKQVSSRILLDFVQPLVQRDIQFESLAQAERNLVYAARDFARFRKEFFVAFASDYYDLIRSFRQIEIDSQNYFSLVRAFNQAEAEFQADQVPLFQVDQVEQNLLNGRGRLVGTCNQVEQALDSLKLSLGVPTETPINIDLAELNELTKLDQLSVSNDSANRVLNRLKTGLEKPDRVQLVSAAANLLEYIINTYELIDSGNGSANLDEFIQQRQRYLIDYARFASQEDLQLLNAEIESETPSTVTIRDRSIAYCGSLLEVIARQLDFVAIQTDSADALQAFDLRREAMLATFAALFVRASGTVSQLDEVAALISEVQELQVALETLIADIDDYLGIEVIDDPLEDLSRIEAQATELASRAEAVLQDSALGLKPVEIDMDDAMLTALVLRFDLMNQRESLADDWRQIKLAADNLKAVIDINATQIIDTDSNSDDPFNFTLDDSRTSLGLTVDAPLNRFVERNVFRATLIDYQRALRNLTQLEDSIKFAIRNDLRNLALDREQYSIAVASAALAYSRVVSTSLEFRLGTGGVTARDFLEAQTAYTDALSSVASRHIDYIVDRAQLFLDLELMYVDEFGFWSDIRNEDSQPEAVYGLPSWAFPIYGKLPCVWYSKEVKQMLCVPVHRQRPFPEFMPGIHISEAEEDELLVEEIVKFSLQDSDDSSIVIPAEEVEPVELDANASPSNTAPPVVDQPALQLMPPE